MSTRPQLPPQQIIGPNSPGAISGDMSQASITSAVTILGQKTVGSVEYSWTGTSPVGTLIIQGSNSYSLNLNGTVNNAGIWTTLYWTLNGGSAVNSVSISGNSGNGIIDLGTGIWAFRTVYTKGSGTGTLLATLTLRVT